MHRIVILLPLVVSACVAAGPEVRSDHWAARPVETGWSGCAAEGGEIRMFESDGLVCVAP